MSSWRAPLFAPRATPNRRIVIFCLVTVSLLCAGRSLSEIRPPRGGDVLSIHGCTDPRTDAWQNKVTALFRCRIASVLDPRPYYCHDQLLPGQFECSRFQNVPFMSSPLDAFENLCREDLTTCCQSAAARCEAYCNNPANVPRPVHPSHPTVPFSEWQTDCRMCCAMGVDSCQREAEEQCTASIGKPANDSTLRALFCARCSTPEAPLAGCEPPSPSPPNPGLMR